MACFAVVSYLVAHSIDRNRREEQGERVAVSVWEQVAAVSSNVRAAISDSIGMHARIVLSAAHNSRTNATSGEMASEVQFRNMYSLLSHALNDFVSSHPYTVAAAVVMGVPAFRVSLLQSWLESLHGVPAGTLNLTMSYSPANGFARIPPPPAAVHWPIVVASPSTDLIASSTFLDVSADRGTALLLAYALSTSDIVSSPALPSNLLPIDDSSLLAGSVQVVAQSITFCDDSLLPAAQCAPTPTHDPTRVLGALGALLDHTLMLQTTVSAVLGQSENVRHEDVRARLVDGAGATVAQHNWEAGTGGDWCSGSALACVQRTVPEFNGRSWTLFLVVEDQGATDALETLTWLLVAACALAALVLAAVVLLHSRTVANLSHAAASRESQLHHEALMDFLRATSHDMRTPLHALGMAVEELRDAHPEVAGADTVRIARRSVATLDLIVNNVLDASRIERGDMCLQMESFSVGRTLESVAEMTRVSLGGRPVAVSVDCEEVPMLLCDVSRVTRCLLNVVGNSAKFTQKGTIRVTAKVVAREPGVHELLLPDDWPADAVAQTWHNAPEGRGGAKGRWGGSMAGDGGAPECNDASSATRYEARGFLVVTVVDTGRGMSAERVATCVQPFLKSKRRNSSGVGLGLHVVLASVLAHGGTLTVASATGRGTVVRMCFQVGIGAADDGDGGSSTQSTVRGHALLASRPPASPLTVLVVDDEVVNAKLLQRMIQRMVGSEARVIVAHDGRQAVSAVESDASCTLVFMDMNMPVMDGLEATRAIRTMGRECRVVMLTGNATEEDRRAAMEAGVDAFESKPCSKAVVRSYLRSAGLLCAGAPAAGSSMTTQSQHRVSRLAMPPRSLTELRSRAAPPRMRGPASRAEELPPLRTAITAEPLAPLPEASFVVSTSGT